MAEIDALLKEDRVSPLARLEGDRHHLRSGRLRARGGRSRGVLGRHSPASSSGSGRGTRCSTGSPPHAQVVRRRQAQRQRQLPRPPRRAPRAATRPRIIWEGEPGDRRTLTYWDLYRQVSAFANVLKSLGVKTRRSGRALSAARFPSSPSRCSPARASAPSTASSSAASAPSRCAIASTTAQCVLLVTADGGYRRGQIVPLKQMADEALERHAVHQERRRRAARRPARRFPCDIQEGRDHWYHRLMQHASPHCEPEAMDAEDMLYILYTSGTTGKPKGIVHTTGGYLVGTYATTKWVFDLKEDDVYWCTADIGWVTGHSYVVYGPLANGATVVMYEGAPDWPQKDRFWELIERHGVTIFYTAPTAIRAFMRWGTEWPAKPRSEHAAAARIGRRADQPRSVDLVSRRTSAASAARSSIRGGRPRPA